MNEIKFDSVNLKKAIHDIDEIIMYLDTFKFKLENIKESFGNIK